MLATKQHLRGFKAYEIDHVNHGGVSGNQEQKSDLCDIGLFNVSRDELRTARYGS